MKPTRSTATLTAFLFLAGAIALSSCGAPDEQPTAGPDAPAQTSQADTDERQRLEVPPEARDLVLAEMRHMLEAVDGTLDGLVSGRMEALAQAARKGGTAFAVDLDPAVADRLPQEFKQLGMRTHRAFDDLAESASTGAGEQEILRQLSELTGNCVACHAAYRLEPSR